MQLLDACEKNKYCKVKERYAHLDFLGAGQILMHDKKKAGKNSTSKLMQAYRRRTGGR